MVFWNKDCISQPALHVACDSVLPIGSGFSDLERRGCSYGKGHILFQPFHLPAAVTRPEPSNLLEPQLAHLGGEAAQGPQPLMVMKSKHLPWLPASNEREKNLFGVFCHTHTLTQT